MCCVYILLWATLRTDIDVSTLPNVKMSKCTLLFEHDCFRSHCLAQRVCEALSRRHRVPHTSLPLMEPSGLTNVALVAYGEATAAGAEVQRIKEAAEKNNKAGGPKIATYDARCHLPHSRASGRDLSHWDNGTHAYVQKAIIEQDGFYDAVHEVVSYTVALGGCPKVWDDKTKHADDDRIYNRNRT